MTRPPPTVAGADGRGALNNARVRGMLLGGALGDALGGPVEFLPIHLIRKRYGPDGIIEPAVAADGLAEITDDTQMTLFTLEGLLRAHHRARLRIPTSHPSTDHQEVRAAVHAAYLRWLHTQRDDVPAARLTGWLISHERLHYPRAPGNTCLTALRATSQPGIELGSTTHPLNTSKGCGGVMRAAPAALWPGTIEDVFRLGVDVAALTHSHATGYLTAGTLAVMVRELLHGNGLNTAIDTAIDVLSTWPNHEETLTSLHAALRLAPASSGRRRFTRRQQPGSPPTPEDIARELGAGWTAEEALAVGVCCALWAEDFPDGVRRAANHSGDSDSTAAITGTLLGAALGHEALPAPWLARLELADVIDQLAQDALHEFDPASHRDEVHDAHEWMRRYPPD